jgi:hypothetical protein
VAVGAESLAASAAPCAPFAQSFDKVSPSAAAGARAGAESDPPTSGASGIAAGIITSSGVTWDIVKSARTNNERDL